MFQFFKRKKNKQQAATFLVSASSPGQPDLSTEEEKATVAIPIHTLDQDLKNTQETSQAGSSNSGSISQTTLRKGSPFNPPQATNLKPDENKKGKSMMKHPFLGKALGAAGNVSSSSPEGSRLPVPSQEKVDLREKKGPRWAMPVIIAVLAGVFLFGIGGGLYYLWTSRTSDGGTAIITPSPEPYQPSPSTPPDSTPAPESPPFELNKINLLVLSSTATRQDLIDLIGATQKTIKEKIDFTAPIEFQLVDEFNNPVSFKRFAELLSITLTQPVLDTLSGSFSLFIKNNEKFASNIPLGFSVEYSGQKENLIALLQTEEPQLLAALETFLSLSAPLPSEKTTAKFLSNTFNNYNIRYLNILSPQTLTIDYLVTDSLFALATTKQLIFDLIDYFEETLVPSTQVDITGETAPVLPVPGNTSETTTPSGAETAASGSTEAEITLPPPSIGNDAGTASGGEAGSTQAGSSEVLQPPILPSLP